MMVKNKKRMAGLIAILIMALLLIPIMSVHAETATQVDPNISVADETEIAFAGHEWRVIGDANVGVNQQVNGLTLLAAYDDWGLIPDKQPSGWTPSWTAFRKGTRSATSVPGYTNYAVPADPSWPADWYYIDNPSGSAWDTPNEYAGSSLQLFMEDIADGIPNNEAVLVLPRTFVGGGTYESPSVDGIAGQGLTDQRMWALSLDEWGMINWASSPSNVDFTVLDPEDSSQWDFANWNRLSGAKFPNRFWLRSPSNETGYRAMDAFGDYDTPPFGYLVNIFTESARPAFTVNMSHALFSTAADGAKSKNAVAEGNALADAAVSDGTVKLTFLDEGLSVDRAVVTSITGNTISFDYAIVATEDSSYNRLSAIVTDGTGVVKYYGNLKEAPAATGNASVTIPDGLVTTDQLFVVTEQVNPDADFVSDFSSVPVELTRTAPTNLNGVACTVPANDNGQITGTTEEMEYRTDSDMNWINMTSSPTGNLKSGNYQVRYSGMVNGIQAIAPSPSAIVTVGAYTQPTLADAAQNILLAPNAVMAGQVFTIEAIGHRQNAVGEVNGDTRYVPFSWDVDLSSGTWADDSSYTANITLNNTGDYTITVIYQLQQWNGTNWEDINGSIDTKTSNITVQTAAPGKEPPTTGTIQPNKMKPNGSPQTGIEKSNVLWLLLPGIILMILVFIRIWKFRRKAE